MFLLVNMGSAFTWVVTAILTVVQLYEALECDPMEVQGCLDRVEGLNIRGNISGLAANKKDLEMACRAFFKGMQCIDEFIKICLSEDKRLSLETQLMGARKAMMNICGAGKTKQNKLTFNNCYPLLSKDIRNCSLPLQRVQRRRHYHSHEDMIKAHCCAQKKYVDCVHYKAKRICDWRASAEALRLAQTVSTNPEFDEQCRAYSLVFDCYSKSNAGLTLYFSYFVALSSLLILFQLQ